MIQKVLALIDRPAIGMDCAGVAMRLAKATQAGLVLAIDPHGEPASVLEVKMAGLVETAIDAGLQTSTMLVHMDDADSIVRTIRYNHIDLVVLPNSASRSTETDDVEHALKRADIPFIPVA
jgi:nucleotide-binding universal stress UspA family protein